MKTQLLQQLQPAKAASVDSTTSGDCWHQLLPTNSQLFLTKVFLEYSFIYMSKMANHIKDTIYFFHSDTQLFFRASLFQRLISTPVFSLRYLTSIHRFLNQISSLWFGTFFWISQTKFFPVLDFPCSHILMILKTIFLQSPPIAIHHNVPPPTIRYGY